MMTHRTNVLLDDETKKVLEFLMKKKKKTAGGVFREYLMKEGENHKLIHSDKFKSRRQVLKDIDRIAKHINTKGINYRELIDDGRKY